MFSGSSVFQSEEIKQWFFYAVKRRTFAALGYVSMLILGCPGSGVAGMLCFLLAFCVLRRYIGGYHASTMLRCLANAYLRVCSISNICSKCSGIHTVVTGVLCCECVFFGAAVTSSDET